MEESRKIGHEPCPNCGSPDNLGRYDDGHGHCFGCGYHEPARGGRGSYTRVEMEEKGFVEGEPRALANRKITQETCAKWGYLVGEDDEGAPCHIANYRDATGKLTHQKLRRAGKKFTMIGGSKAPLYGMWLWGKGKSLVITEGEIDALSYSQAFDNRYAVVSVPNGASSAAKDIARYLEYLDAFERIVIMFDQDEPGRKAAEEVAMLLPPGKAYIAVLPEKDANDVLVKQGAAALVKAFWEAKSWRPDGIVSGAEFTVEQLKQACPPGYTLPYPRLQDKLYGLRKGELTLLTAGSGIGKSSWAREIAYYLHQHHHCTIGNVYLEESNAKTAQAYIAIHSNIPLGKLRAHPDLLSDEQWEKALDEVIHEGMWFYNHFGSLDSTNLLSKLRYLAVVCKVDFIILDHISIVTSGIESSSEGERKDIDILMTRLRSLVEQTGVGVIAIVHLKRVKDKVFNEGSEVSLSDLRGSGSLEQLSDNVLALERDQQDEEKKDISNSRVLKCRETGDTGLGDTLLYERGTGRLGLAPKTDMTL